MITPQKMADVTNYLYAAQALTPVEGMSAVWADYTNAEIPGLSPADLLPAARLCLKKWAAEGRSWKVDLPRFVEACRAIRRQRLDTWKQQYGEPTPDHELPELEWRAWIAAAKSAIHGGATDPEAVRIHAWQSIGQSPPVIEPTTSHHINIQQIGRS